MKVALERNAVTAAGLIIPGILVLISKFLLPERPFTADETVALTMAGVAMVRVFQGFLRGRGWFTPKAEPEAEASG